MADVKKYIRSSWMNLEPGDELVVYEGNKEEEIGTYEDGIHSKVQFRNGEQVLQTVIVKDGETPVYTGPTPKKATDFYLGEQYTFSGWSPTVGPVYKNTVYQAQFTATPVVYSNITVEMTSGNSWDIYFNAAEWQGEIDLETYEGDFLYTSMSIETDAETGESRAVLGEIISCDDNHPLNQAQYDDLWEYLDEVDGGEQAMIYFQDIGFWGTKIDMWETGFNNFHLTVKDRLNRIWNKSTELPQYTLEYKEDVEESRKGFNCKMKDGYILRLTYGTDAETGDSILETDILYPDGETTVLPEQDTDYTALMRYLGESFKYRADSFLYSGIDNLRPHYFPIGCVPQGTNLEDWSYTRIFLLHGSDFNEGDFPELNPIQYTTTESSMDLFALDYTGNEDLITVYYAEERGIAKHAVPYNFFDTSYYSYQLDDGTSINSLCYGIEEAQLTSIQKWIGTPTEPISPQQTPEAIAGPLLLCATLPCLRTAQALTTAIDTRAESQTQAER